MKAAGLPVDYIRVGMPAGHVLRGKKANNQLDLFRA
jgi:hypothetical protein